MERERERSSFEVAMAITRDIVICVVGAIVIFLAIMAYLALGSVADGLSGKTTPTPTPSLCTIEGETYSC